MRSTIAASRSARRLAAVAAAVAIALLAPPPPVALAQARTLPDGAVTYRVAPGDTLIGLGERLLDP
ncbi:MAG: hypothetical protein WCK28_21380, partial [Burkholderiales bacterium]